MRSCGESVITSRLGQLAARSRVSSLLDVLGQRPTEVGVDPLDELARAGPCQGGDHSGGTRCIRGWVCRRSAVFAASVATPAATFWPGGSLAPRQSSNLRSTVPEWPQGVFVEGARARLACRSNDLSGSSSGWIGPVSTLGWAIGWATGVHRVFVGSGTDPFDAVRSLIASNGWCGYGRMVTILPAASGSGGDVAASPVAT